MAITGQYGKGQYGESTVGPEKPQEERNPDLKTRIMSGAKDLKDKAIIAGKNFKSALGSASEKANKPKEYVDPYNQKQDVTYRTPNAPDTNEQNMADSIGQTEDLIQRGATEGEKANKTLQNVEIPRSKLVSYNDIINSDEFKGQRVPYLANAIGSNLANLLTGKDYQSYLKQQNQAMSDTYAQNKAARDTAATQANIQDIEAGNKAEMGKYVQQSDAITEQALKRYGLLEDQETKKQILNEIVTQATGKGMDKWNSLSASEKLAAMALMQAYNGDYSVASMVIEKYGDKIFNVLDKLLGVNNGNGGGNDDNPDAPTVVTNSLGQKIDVGKAQSDTKGKYILLPGINGEPDEWFEIPSGISDDYKDFSKFVAQRIAQNPALTDEEKENYMKQITSVNYNISRAKEDFNAANQTNTDFKKSFDKALKGKTSEDRYNALSSLSTEGLTSNSLVEEYQKALEENGVAAVKDAINSILSQEGETNDKIKAVETLANTDKYRNLVSQNPEVQKLVGNTKEDLVSKAIYIDPYNKRASGRFYNALSNTTGGNKFIIKDDGTIEIQMGKNKSKILNPYSAVGISNAGTNPDVFLSALKDNVTMDSVRSQMGDIAEEDLVPIFKNTPMYKMLEGIANTKDKKLMENKYWKDIVDIYYDWDKY